MIVRHLDFFDFGMMKVAGKMAILSLRLRQITPNNVLSKIGKTLFNYLTFKTEINFKMNDKKKFISPIVAYPQTVTLKALKIPSFPNVQYKFNAYLKKLKNKILVFFQNRDKKLSKTDKAENNTASNMCDPTGFQRVKGLKFLTHFRVS